MNERFLSGESIIGRGLPRGLAWSRGPRPRRKTLVRTAGGVAVLMLVALLLGGMAEDDARALPFTHARDAARDTIVAAAAVVREALPPALSPAPPESFPYRVVEQLALGEASYYARQLEGRRTANGETYRHDGLTAAHRTLPFGTLLRVTNVKNGLSVIVRVNDRGPFHARRVLDLSEAAAREVGLFRRGRGKVKVELVARLDAAAAR